MGFFTRKRPPTSSTSLTPMHRLLSLVKPSRTHAEFADMLKAKASHRFSPDSMDPHMYEILASNPGTYNECTGPTLWVLMGGHFRTMDQHIANTDSFLKKSSRCYFLLCILRPYIAEDSTSCDHKFGPNSPEAAMWRSANVTARVEKVRTAIGTNMAYVVTLSKHKQHVWANTDTLKLGGEIIKALLEFHGIVRHDRDVAVFTRPDIVFRQAIDMSTLARIPQRFVLNIPHRWASPGSSTDPSEVFVVMSMNVWMEDRIGFPSCGNLFGFDVTHMCSGVAGYVRTDFDVHAHRLGAGLDQSNPIGQEFNAPCSNMRTGVVDAAMDLTRFVLRAYSGNDSNIIGTTKCHGLAQHFVAKKRTDLQLDFR